MPKLFISYKRKTDGIEKLKADLRAAKYALWFDRDDIHLGSEDWQADIERGIQGCDAMILCLTPDACASKPIQFELRTARRLNKLIFPIMLETLPDIPAGLHKIGLPKRQHVEDFTRIDTWDEQFAKLITSLRERGLGVTPHDLRQLRGEREYRLHQDYLDKVIRQIGRLPLAAINPKYTHAEGTPLEDVYLPLPLKYTLSIEVRDYRIEDWWIGEAGKGDRPRYPFGTAKPEDYPPSARRRPADLGWNDTAALKALIDQQQIELDQQRERAKEKGERYYKQIGDGVYPDHLPLDFEAAAAACSRLVLLGSPGIGKTIAGRHLALCLAGAERDNWTRTATLSGLGQWTHSALTPIYVELRALVSSQHFPESLDGQPTADHLWAYIRHEVLGAALADYAPILEDDLKNGSAVLIFDGLDEVPYPRGKGNLQKRQTQLKSLARAIDDAYGSIRVIVTSRPYAYEGWSLPGYSSVELAPFADEQRISLAGNLYRCGGDPSDTAQARAQRLNQALQPIDAELKDRPLFVTLMATLFAVGESEGLPTRKGALYRESVLLLLDRWTSAKPGAPTLTDLLGNANRADLLDRLGALAYNVHEQLGDQPGTPEIPRALLSRSTSSRWG